MTERNDDLTHFEDERHLRAAVRALPPVLPDPAFRERARAAFLRPPLEAVPAPSGSVPRSRRLPWIAAATAAAAVLALFLLAPGSALEWSVDTATSQGTVLIDGSPASSAMLAQALPTGARIANAGPGPVCLVVENALTYLLAPGAELSLDARTPRFGATTLRTTVHQGEVMGRTFPGFPDGGLEIETAEANVRITGTTFGVIVAGDSTCVCVFEGTVATRALSAEREVAVAADRRQVLYGDGRPPALRPLRPLPAGEAAMLRELDRVAPAVAP